MLKTRRQLNPSIHKMTLLSEYPCLRGALTTSVVAVNKASDRDTSLKQKFALNKS